jgi:hypothetical protein
MDEDKPKKKKSDNPTVDYIISRLAYAFGYRTA